MLEARGFTLSGLHDAHQISLVANTVVLLSEIFATVVTRERSRI